MTAPSIVLSCAGLAVVVATMWMPAAAEAADSSPTSAPVSDANERSARVTDGATVSRTVASPEGGT